MPELEILDMDKKVTGKLSLPEDLFGIKGGEALMHSAVVNYLANQRQGTHATKTKGLVSGGGKKPYRQKHTGRARAGSNRSPLWRGGGTIFGPQPRDYSYSMPRKARKIALFTAMSRKIADGEVMVLKGIEVEAPKTRRVVDMIRTLGLDGKSLLIVIKEADSNVLLSARNIEGVDVARASDLHAYDLLSHDRVVITEEAVKSMEAMAS